MKKIGLRLAAVLLFAMGFGARGQETTKDIGNPKDDTSGTEVLTGTATDTALRNCMAMYYSITDNGHRWNMDAQNNCGRPYTCHVYINLKTSNGLTTNGSCDPGVPVGPSRVCSHGDVGHTWVSVINAG